MSIKERGDFRVLCPKVIQSLFGFHFAAGFRFQARFQDVERCLPTTSFGISSETVGGRLSLKPIAQKPFGECDEGAGNKDAQ